MNDWVWAGGWWWFCAEWGKTWSYETYPPWPPAWWVFRPPTGEWSLQTHRPDQRTGRGETMDIEWIQRELRRRELIAADEDHDVSWFRRRRTYGAE